MTEYTIEFAFAGDDIMIVRLNGRGCMQNSLDLQKLANKLRKQNPNFHIIFDLENCISVDSSFMGTMVGLSTEQKKTGSQYVTVVNLQDHVRNLLVNIGFDKILDIREKADIPSVESADFKQIEKTDSPSKIEQIVHTIAAHKALINLDTQNEIRFQSVVKYLEDSLDREKKKNDDKTTSGG